MLFCLPCAAQAQVTFKYMGEMSCGAWPKLSPYTDIQKAAVLNWVLGYLSRASWADNHDLLSNVDQPSVSAWLDNYCAANPLEAVTSAVHALEQQLLVRTGPLPLPPAPPLIVAPTIRR